MWLFSFYIDTESQCGPLQINKYRIVYLGRTLYQVFCFVFTQVFGYKMSFVVA